MSLWWRIDVPVSRVNPRTKKSYVVYLEKIFRMLKQDKAKNNEKPHFFSVFREIMRSALLFKLLLSLGEKEQIKCQGAQCCLHHSHHSVLRNTKATESIWKMWNKEDLLLVEDDHFGGHLKKLELHWSVSSVGLDPQVLREISPVIVRPLSVIIERSWWLGEVSKDWKRISITAVFK